MENKKSEVWQNLARWYNNFGHKEITPQDAIKLLKPGNKLFIHSGCSQPQKLTSELYRQHQYLKDIEIHHFLSIYSENQRILKHKPQDLFRYNAFFLGEQSIRDAVNSGQADYTPIGLSEIPSLFHSGRKSIDVALIQVSPPDKNDYCSLGVNVDVAKPIMEEAELVIAEVNPNVPRVHGNSFVHMSKIDHFVYNEVPLLEYNHKAPDEVTCKIARNVASLVHNGSTIQVGLGDVPHAVLNELIDHKNLGIHSDSFFDGFVDLIEQGAVSNKLKTVSPGRSVACFGLGTKKLFDYVDDNLGIEFQPANYTNNPLLIAKNHQMTTINGAISVDLMGQINADSIGPIFYSGIGGLVDFSRGASYSKGGMPIICFPSTAIGGSLSRIVPTLISGSHVSLTMADVHYVVTEYGIAQLYGKNIRERALALISIAHPKFRKWLLDEAKKLNYCYSDQQLATDSAGHVIIYPEKYRSIFIVGDTTEVHFRPILPTDERLVQDLYYSLDEESRIYRFFRKKKYFERPDVQMDILMDYENILGLIGVVGDVGHEKAVALCSYEKNSTKNLAEIAFTVHNEWRNKGLTTYMLQQLIRIAKEKEVVGFNGEIMWENKAMEHIIKNCGYIVKVTAEESGWFFQFLFEENN